MLILYPCYYAAMKFGVRKFGKQVIWSLITINVVVFLAIYFADMRIVFLV